MHMKIWLTVALQIILLNKCGHQQEIQPLEPIWDDLRFDRANVLTLFIKNWNGKGHNHTNVAIGVWIASNRILTSYNPFRSIVRNETESKELNAMAITGRVRNTQTQTEWEGIFTKNKVECGRPLVYIPDEQLKADKLWHYESNSPLHDLMVFRIVGNVTLSSLASKDYTMAMYPENVNTTYVANVLLTAVANETDYMGAEFMYVENIKIKRSPKTKLRKREFDPDDDAVVECDEWLKRDWGYFICVRNKYQVKSIESGAILVSEAKVFGVFSFLMFRGTESICVFTDVRPYYDHIMKTCTSDDEQ